jgi:hypothetical protein
VLHMAIAASASMSDFIHRLMIAVCRRRQARMNR